MKNKVVPWLIVIVRILFAPIVGIVEALKCWTGKAKLGLPGTWDQRELRRKYHMPRLEAAEGFAFLGSGLAIGAVELMLFVAIPLNLAAPSVSDAVTNVVFGMMGVAIVSLTVNFVLGNIDHTKDKNVRAMEYDFIHPTLY